MNHDDVELGDIMKAAQYIARTNTWLVLLFGLVLGVYESTTRDYSSYPYTYDFDWWLFTKWGIATYFIAMIFYLFSEILRAEQGQRGKANSTSAPIDVHFNEFRFSDDTTRIDKSAVLDFLSRSYWANQRPQDRTLKAIEHSYCLGVFKDDKQIGFARVISDSATFFYICDVFVSEEYRGKGIGKKLIELIVESDRFDGMTGLLGTLDAHGLYEKYGFIRDPDRFMKRLPKWAGVVKKGEVEGKRT